MLKKLILLFVLCFPMIQNVLFTLSFGEGWGEAFAQVVIKDEIFLDEIDAEMLTMPFYGKVRGNVCSYCYDYGALKLVTIKANGQIVEKGWWDNCGGGSVTSDWSISHLPAGTPIEINVYICVNNVFTEAQTELQTNKVRYYSPNHLQWFDATSFEFIEQTPTFSCSTLTPCEYPQSPSLKFERKDPGYKAYLDPNYFEELHPCIGKSCTTNVMASIDFAPWHSLIDVYEWNLQPCTISPNGDVKFKYSLNYNGQPVNEIPWVYVIEYCPNDCVPPKVIIENETQLQNILTPDNICIVENDICNHDGNYPIPAQYVLKESLTMHEETIHLGDYKFLLDLYKVVGFDQKVDAYSGIPCSTWLNNPSQAMAMAILNYDNILSKYYQEVKDQYNAIQYPERGMTSFEHTFMLIRYYNVAESWRKSHGINCPSNICNNLKIFNVN